MRRQNIGCCRRSRGPAPCFPPGRWGVTAQSRTRPPQGLYGSDLPTDVGRVGDAHRNNTFRAANACRSHSIGAPQSGRADFSIARLCPRTPDRGNVLYRLAFVLRSPRTPFLDGFRFTDHPEVGHTSQYKRVCRYKSDRRTVNLRLARNPDTMGSATGRLRAAMKETYANRAPGSLR